MAKNAKCMRGSANVLSLDAMQCDHHVYVKSVLVRFPFPSSFPFCFALLSFCLWGRLPGITAYITTYFLHSSVGVDQDETRRNRKKPTQHDMHGMYAMYLECFYIPTKKIKRKLVLVLGEARRKGEADLCRPAQFLQSGQKNKTRRRRRKEGTSYPIIIAMEWLQVTVKAKSYKKYSRLSGGLESSSASSSFSPPHKQQHDISLYLLMQ